MPTLVSELLSSDYALSSGELNLFAIPLAVVALGVGVSFLMSCVSNSKSRLLERLDADEPKTVMVQELVKDMEAEQAHISAEELAEELSPDRLLSMATLDGPDSPAPRVGAGADFDPAAGIFIVAGGMADDTVSAEINVYSVEEKKWAQFQSSAPGFGFLYGYMGMLAESVVVFGGIGEDNAPRDTLQIYNFDALTWEQLPLVPGSPAPCARFNGSASALGDGRMVLFGGRDGDGQCLNDVWVLELRGLEAVWTMLYDGGSVNSDEEEEDYIPEPREAHSAAVVGGTLFVFGGSSAEGDVLNTDGAVVEAFDLETCRWSLHEARGCAPQVLCSGGSAHALPSVNKVLIVSGEESDVSFFNALHILDVTGLVTEGGSGVAEWALCGVNWCGDVTMPPDARLFHAAALDAAEGDLYIFGGQQMCADEGAPALQESVAVLDLAHVMQLLPERTESSEQEMAVSGDLAAADDEETPLEDMPLDDMEPVQEGSEGGDTEHGADNAMDLDPLFGGLTENTVKMAVVDIANETLEDFERVRGEVDLAFASKYASAAELELMRLRLSCEVSERAAPHGAPVSSCPMPRGKKSASS